MEVELREEDGTAPSSAKDLNAVPEAPAMSLRRHPRLTIHSILC
jgi:hypothetical protein